MEWLTILWRYRNEIGIAILAIVVCLVIFDIRNTYKKAEQQEAEIKLLQKGLDDARKAVKLQADVQKEWGQIDRKTYKNISTVLAAPVPVVLIPGGVFRK